MASRFVTDLALFLAMFAFASSAGANQSTLFISNGALPPVPSVSIQMIHASGQVEHYDLHPTLSWKLDKLGRPSLQLSLAIPPNALGAGTVIENPVDKDGRLIVELNGLDTEYKFRAIDAKGIALDSNFFIHLNQPSPLVWIDQSCQNERVTFREDPNNSSNFLYWFARCDRVDRNMRVAIYGTGGLNVSGFRPETIGDTKVYSYNFDKSVFQPQQVRFQVQNKEDTATSTSAFTASYVNIPPRSRFSASIGTSATMLNFIENPGGLSVQEFEWTAKLMASFYIIPDKVFLSGNIFSTVLPLITSTTLNNSPASLPSAQFLGANLRAGYRFRLPFMKGNWSVSTGWYYWQMTVANNIYGLLNVSGPQVFLTYDMALPSDHSLFVYVKYAPLFQTSAFVSGNYEIALGGGYKLSPARWTHRLDLTTDLSSLSFTSPIDSASSGLVTVSLGLQFWL